MRRARQIGAACALALASGAAVAEEIFVDRGGFDGHNLYVDAERVMHHGRAYLSIQIRGWDRVAKRLPNVSSDLERVVVSGQGPAYLPVIVACDRMVLEHAGRTIMPDAESLCAAPTKLPGPQGMPLFVAFPFPPAEDVRQARLVVPVTVLPPDPPVQRSVRPEKRIELYEPRVDAARLGEHTLHATVQLR
jgi:hypothetical protein